MWQKGPVNGGGGGDVTVATMHFMTSFSGTQVLCPRVDFTSQPAKLPGLSPVEETSDLSLLLSCPGTGWCGKPN